MGCYSLELPHENLHEEESGREQSTEISICIRRPKPATEIKTQGDKKKPASGSTNRRDQKSFGALGTVDENYE
jgi:hypothetical protein